MSQDETILEIDNRDQKVVAKSKHRKDIQWIRAIAIIAVLAFHLKPNSMPQGYLGVDIFFVISGYLMSSILNFSSTKRLTLDVLTTFYTRRIKRIFPVYLLVVLLTLVACSLFLIDWDLVTVKADTIWAMTFSTNIQSMMDKESYFKQVGEFKFLLHTWSLSVEIQYYLIAPFLLYFIHLSQQPLIASAVIASVSWAFQSFGSNPIVTFGFLFSRIWQFLVGTFVFYAEKQYNSANPLLVIPKQVAYLVTIVFMVVVLVMPAFSASSIYVVAVRTISTLLTGKLIYLGKNVEFNNPKLLIDPMTFIGDISYSVYLIHWPIIVFAKYQLVFDDYSVFLFTGLIFIISVLQYKWIELKLAKRSTIFTTMTMACLYLSIVLCLSLPRGLGIFNEPGNTDAIETNQKLLSECNNQLEQLRHNCTMDPPFDYPKENMPLDTYVCSYRGNGTGTIFMTGNSYAMRQIYGLINQLQGRYDRLYVAAQSMCTVFLDLNDPSFRCDFVSSRVMEIMKLVKPDVMIVTQRLSTGTPMNNPLNSTEDAKNDRYTQIFRRYWNEYSNLTKQIIIVQPHPTFYDTPMAPMTKLMRPGENLDDYFISEEDFDKEVNPGWWRTVASTDTCKICTTVPIKKHFCHTNKKCDIYDKKTKTLLYCDPGHFTTVGSARIMPDVAKAISSDLVY